MGWRELLSGKAHRVPVLAEEESAARQTPPRRTLGYEVQSLHWLPLPATPTPDAQARLLASSLALGDDESRLAPSERTGCSRLTYGADRLLNFLSLGGIGAVAESVNGHLIDTFVFLTCLSPLGLDGIKLLLTCVPVGYMLPAVVHLVPELTGKRRKGRPGGTDVVPVPTTLFPSPS